MHKISHAAICMFILFLIGIHVYGVPAKPSPFTFKQSDGSEIMVRLFGDENYHFYLSEDGVLLLPDAQGDFYFAEQESDGAVKKSAVLAKNVNQRNASEQLFVSSLNKDQLLKKYETRYAANNQMKFSAPMKRASSAYPTKGQQKVLVILAEFSDVHFQTENPKEAFYRLMNEPGYSENGGTGSARDFYMESSFGQYEPMIDVYGPVVLPHEMKYYGAPSAGANDIRPAEMIRDACQLLDSEIDFSEYDLDQDGAIDNVYLFYAGYGQADGGNVNTIWPHAWYVWQGARIMATFDGVQLDRYACSNEIQSGSNEMVGIGTFCHEFGHVLGLPDLYSASYSSTEHPGNWTLMASGSYNNNGKTPPYFSAYERYALGWITPKVINPADTVFVLPAISTNEAYMIKTNKENEYILLENRQLQKWDTYLPGHGMLVWHIDYNEYVWARNTVNDNSAHQYVDIEEADGIASDATRTGDPFPGTSGAISITDDTKPGLLAWDGSRRNIGIYNIYETADSIILFDAIDTTVKLDAGVTKEATEVTPVSFRANWEKVANATGYVIDVYKKNAQNGKEVLAYLDGYRAKQVGNVDSEVILNLEPETDYYYTVRGKGNTYIGDYSEETVVRTLDKDFRFFAPVVTAATAVTSNSFTANWELMEEAQSYQVSVYRLEKGDLYYEINDFFNGVKVPEGWDTNCTVTYAAPGYFGKESPAISANRDGTYVQSPIGEDGVESLSFWYRGSSNLAEDSKLNIYGYKDGEWKILTKIESIEKSLGGAEVTLDASLIGDSCFAIRIEHKRPTAGSVALDDIVVGYRSIVNVELPEYTDTNVMDKLYLQVSGLEPNTIYGYKVKANNGVLDSMPSDLKVVRTLEAGNSIETITEVFNWFVSDRKLILKNYSAECIDAEVYTISGILLDKVSLGIGTTVIALPDNNIYIMKVDGKVYKIIL